VPYVVLDRDDISVKQKQKKEVARSGTKRLLSIIHQHKAAQTVITSFLDYMKDEILPHLPGNVANTLPKNLNDIDKEIESLLPTYIRVRLCACVLIIVIVFESTLCVFVCLCRSTPVLLISYIVARLLCWTSVLCVMLLVLKKTQLNMKKESHKPNLMPLSQLLQQVQLYQHHEKRILHSARS